MNKFNVGYILKKLATSKKIKQPYLYQAARMHLQN
jgi:hypothetical protein